VKIIVCTSSGFAAKYVQLRYTKDMVDALLDTLWFNSSFNALLTTEAITLKGPAYNGMNL